jgi:hypothetical protein
MAQPLDCFINPNSYMRQTITEAFAIVLHWANPTEAGTAGSVTGGGTGEQAATGRFVSLWVAMPTVTMAVGQVPPVLPLQQLLLLLLAMTLLLPIMLLLHHLIGVFVLLPVGQLEHPLELTPPLLLLLLLLLLGCCLQHCCCIHHLSTILRCCRWGNWNNPWNGGWVRMPNMPNIPDDSRCDSNSPYVGEYLGIFCSGLAFGFKPLIPSTPAGRSSQLAGVGRAYKSRGQWLHAWRLGEDAQHA